MLGEGVLQYSSRSVGLVCTKFTQTKCVHRPLVSNVMSSSKAQGRWSDALPNGTRTAWTATRPSFIMPFADPAFDLGVSRAMVTSRAIEPGNALFWHRALLEPCAHHELFLDVGSNFGYYALLAAVMGCEVIAWEPVPHFRALIELGAQLNNVSALIQVRAAVVSNVSGHRVSLAVPRRGLWGTASLASMDNIDAAISGGFQDGAVDVVWASTESIDEVLSSLGKSTQTIGALKVDVEGHEPRVLFGAAHTLRRQPPRTLFLEYTPGVAERRGIRHGEWDEVELYPRALAMLRECGFRIWHLGGLMLRRGPSWLPCTRGRFGIIPGCEYSNLQLSPLREVTEASVRAEFRNAMNLAAEPRAAYARGSRRAGTSFSLPWDLHPASLHAEFTHNTDLLCTHQESSPVSHLAITREGDVGVTSHSTYGLGGGLCEDVARDGSLREVIGRLCLPPGSRFRNASIEAAITNAERSRTGESSRAFDALRVMEASRWQKVGRGSVMRLERISDGVSPPPSAAISSSPPRPLPPPPPPPPSPPAPSPPLHLSPLRTNEAPIGFQAVPLTVEVRASDGSIGLRSFMSLWTGAAAVTLLLLIVLRRRLRSIHKAIQSKLAAWPHAAPGRHG